MHPEEILQQYWGYNAFRGRQKDIIENVLQGNDTLALLPTGGGKSICYQVPALMMDGVCLVISPLIALMKDQVANLLSREIPSAAIYSGMTFYEVQKTLQDAVDGNIRFLYVSPERLETAVFKEYLSDMSVSLIAVDEAHCISQWGYDFRPPYLRIAALKHELPNVPILAVTASATPLVEKDIIDKLVLKDVTTFRQSFIRPNISYSVFKVDSKINKLQEILTNVGGSSIVYCKSRKLTRDVAQLLQMANISADHYHAGLIQEERATKQDAWQRNKTRVMVCTNAFGMGIDKPDVRTVIHYDAPDCLENYYQEAGRAGRDGKRSYAVLLYQSEDITSLEAMPDVKYPDIYSIKKVYQALADFLQVPVGIGEGNFYDFDLNEFIRNFKLEPQLVINVLKVLEQEGYVSFSETIFLPSKVVFTAPKALLEDFENAHPDLEPVMKCLLRTYQGIYDNRVSVFEKQIAKLARLPLERVFKDLKQLQAFGIIEYLSQKDTPQLNFITNRAPAEFLYIDQRNYLLRKKQYEERVQSMLSYIRLRKDCRSTYIAQYFGDTDINDCGVCDNCLHKKNTELTPSEMKNITDRIFMHLDANEIPVNTLLALFRDVSKEKMWQVLNFLQSEGKINISDLGIVKKL